ERGTMLSSVKAGLAAVEHRAQGAFIVLGDQPLVLPATLRTMASAYWARRPRVIVPTHAGRRGQPVLLCTRGIREILALSDHATLDSYTSRHSHQTMEIMLDDPAIVRAFNAPADQAAAGAQPRSMEGAFHCDAQAWL